MDDYVDGVSRRTQDAVEAAIADVARHVERTVTARARGRIADLEREVDRLKGQLAACPEAPVPADVTFFAAAGLRVKGALDECLAQRGPFGPGTRVRVVMSVPPLHPEALVMDAQAFAPWARVRLELVGPYPLLGITIVSAVDAQGRGFLQLHNFEVRGPVHISAPGGLLLLTSGNTRFLTVAPQQAGGAP